MKTDSGASLLFAALVPHKDAVSVLEKTRRHLFAAGLYGAFSFPAVIPLAVLAAPLSDGELKSLAAGLRQSMGNEQFTSCGKIQCVSLHPEPAVDGPFFRLYGPEYRIPPLSFTAAVRPASFVLAAALLAGGDAPERISSAPEFRAAALANIWISVMESPYSLKWKTGKLFWLPQPGKKRE